MKISFNEKKNTLNVMNQAKEFTTLKSQNQKENNKKLFLLVNANSSSLKTNK